MNSRGFQVLQECGALLTGHFELHSQRHSTQYIEKTRIFRRPDLLSSLCVQLAKMVSDKFNGFSAPQIEAVVGPTSGGALVAHWLAYHLGKLYGEPVLAFSTRRDFRGSHILALQDIYQVSKKNVLVADDVLTTGETVRDVLLQVKAGPVDSSQIGQTLDFIQSASGSVLGAAVLFDRRKSRSRKIFGTSLFTLFRVPLEDWDKEECPLCKQGIPITKV